VYTGFRVMQYTTSVTAKGLIDSSLLVAYCLLLVALNRKQKKIHHCHSLQKCIQLF